MNTRMVRRALKMLKNDPLAFINKVGEFFNMSFYRMISFWKDPVTNIKKAHRRNIYRRRFSMNLVGWLRYHHTLVMAGKCRWMGVQAMKNPLDSWIYQEIIYEVKPDIIIEIGSAQGGSTLYLANLLDIIGKGEVISVDIDRKQFNVKHPRITILTGDSSSLPIAQKVLKLCAGKTVMVIHDGDHHKPQILKDLAVYAPIVSKGSYLIVEDSIVDLLNIGDGLGVAGNGPLCAVEEFLNNNHDFIIDNERERYLITYNTCTYLKKIC